MLIGMDNDDEFKVVVIVDPVINFS